MNATEFVSCWKQEKDDLVNTYIEAAKQRSIPASMDVARYIASLNLSSQQMEILRSILEGVLRDAFYSLLLGLDGETSIGDVQQTYRIFDEDGNLFSECGELESEAWNQLHGDAP